MSNIDKIGHVEQLDLIPADDFTDVSETELADWINTGHIAIKMAVRRLAIHVAQVGAWLVAAKDKCQHGEWLPWLAENCPEISESTHNRYVKTYKKVTANPSVMTDLRNMTPMQGYSHLGIVKDPTDQTPAETPPLPDGEYRCVVIDPPWPMQKIDRDIIPYEEKLDYPVMTIDEIKELKPLFAEGGCHVYLWTTHKFLPDAFEVFESWNVRYECLLTWDKTKGMTPFSWMYSTEFVLFGRVGVLDLLKKGEKVVFHGDRREHSRKPDEFYDLVRLVSPEPRLDMFSREKREGFDQWGIETGHFK